VQRLAVVTDVDRFVVWGDRIRWVLRPVGSRYGILRSTLFTVENVVRDGRLVGVVLRGGGFGHGVGLCQTGALARARAGQDARTILRAYYEGIDVVDVRSLRGWNLAR
jgi:stage II sporulation protein D